MLEQLDDLCTVLEPIYAECVTLLGAKAWREVVGNFLRAHPHARPWQTSLPLAMRLNLQDHPPPQAPAWLPDLAHLLWATWVVGTTKAAVPPHDSSGDLMSAPVALHPACMDLACDWPVHRILAGGTVSESLHTQLLVCPDRDGVVRVWPSKRFTTQVLGLLKQGLSGHDSALAMARWFHLPQAQAMVQACHALVTQLHQQGVVLGAARQQD